MELFRSAGLGSLGGFMAFTVKILRVLVCGAVFFIGGAASADAQTHSTQPAYTPKQVMDHYMPMTRDEIERERARHARENPDHEYIGDLTQQQQEAYMLQYMSTPSFRKKWHSTSPEQKQQFCQNAMQNCSTQGMMAACDFYKKSCR
jgi:ABC-type transporter MlaC component